MSVDEIEGERFFFKHDSIFSIPYKITQKYVIYNKTPLQIKTKIYTSHIMNIYRDKYKETKIY